MSKECIITSKTKETIRFHETFLSFGDYRSLGHYYLSSCPQKLRSPLPMQLPRFHALEKDTDATVGAPARWHAHRTPQHLKAQGGDHPNHNDGSPYNGYHGNPKPSFLGVITVITHILMAYNFHFSWALGVQRPLLLGWWVYPLIIWIYIYIMGV